MDYIVTNIPIDKISYSPVNKRSFKDLTSIKELAANIEKVGLLHPVVVRLHPDKKSSSVYELVSGERRVRAGIQLKHKFIPSVVRELSDSEAYEITASENLQREDLTPIEEAESIQTLLTLGQDPSEIADRLGKSKQWIVRRSKLINLDKVWIEEFKNPDSAIINWSGAHFELIARYNKKYQMELYDEMLNYHGNDLGSMSAKAFSEHLNKDLLYLNLAPWKLNDETLLSSVNACLSCNSRSSCAPDLFDTITTKKGVEKDYCLDSNCWSKKLIAYNKLRIRELKDKHSDLILIKSHGNNILPVDHPWKDIVQDNYRFMDSNKSDKDAKPALLIDGAGVGKLKYVKDYSNSYGGSSAKIKGQPVPLVERRKALNKRRTIRYINKILQLFEGFEPVDVKKDVEPEKLTSMKVPGKRLTNLELFSLIAAFGCSSHYNSENYNAKWWQIQSMVFDSGADVAYDIVFQGITYEISKGLRSEINSFTPNKKFVDNICRCLYLDAAGLWKIVLEEIKEPKIWATLNEDGTKKSPVEKGISKNDVLNALNKAKKTGV